MKNILYAILITLILDCLTMVGFSCLVWTAIGVYYQIFVYVMITVFTPIVVYNIFNKNKKL